MTRKATTGFITSLLLWLPFHAIADSAKPLVEVTDAGEKYRQIEIRVTGAAPADAAAYQVWFSDAPFRSTHRAELHSVLLIGDTTMLKRAAPGTALNDCNSDGQPMHRNDQGRPVISPETRQWSCNLTGMRPAADQWIAVVPVDLHGRSLVPEGELNPVKGRTDAADERTPPPDTRPVTYALGAIVLSAIVLLSFLRWSDAKRGRNRSRLAHLYVAPALIALAALTFYPISYGIWLAFTNADQSHLGDETWIGLQNFVTVLTSPGLWRVTAFTLVWAICNVVAHVSLGLMLALTLNRRGLKGKTVYRTILLLPWAIPAYISVLAWNGMLQPEGLFNNILGTEIDFLASITSAQVTVIIANIWLGVPFMMASFSGALQAIPSDIYEAAEVDGVSSWHQLRHLTLPNLKSTMVPVSLLGFIWSFNAFSTIYLMTRGGPYVGFGEPGATDILITYVFDVAFVYGHYGIAAAWSVLIFLLLVAFSWAYMKRTRATEAVG